MFGRIAKRYDLLNRLITFGRDRAWRHETVQRLAEKPGSLCPGIYLDAGCGTGDLAFEILAQNPAAQVVAADLTPEMIAHGRLRKGAEKIAWVIADGQHLPFRSASFDGLVSGYLLRNVANLEQALQEQRRVLKTSGTVAALDTTRPARNLLLPFITFYYKFIIPLLGRLIAGDTAAYTYLPATSARFLSAPELAQRLEETGFSQVGFLYRMFRTQAIHFGKKQSRPKNTDI